MGSNRGFRCTFLIRVLFYSVGLLENAGQRRWAPPPSRLILWYISFVQQMCIFFFSLADNGLYSHSNGNMKSRSEGHKL
jgi:hypothetical protein